MNRGFVVLPSIILVGFLMAIFPLSACRAAIVLDTTDFLIAYLHSDGDGDGLLAKDEINIYKTNPNIADTDGDGLNDGDELAYWGASWSADSDGDGLANLVDVDSDNDGLNDGDEVAYGTNPAASDSDNDGIDDNAEKAYWAADWNGDADGDGVINILDFDSDNDGMADGWEIANNLDPAVDSDATADADGDYVSNFVEYKVGTDPNNSNDVPVGGKTYKYNDRAELTDSVSAVKSLP